MDTGAPDVIISTKLARAIKIAPDINYNQTFGTTRPSLTQAVGAYSAITIKLGQVVVQTPAICLDNKSCDILNGASYLKRWNFSLDLRSERFFVNKNPLQIFWNKGCSFPSSKERVITMLLMMRISSLLPPTFGQLPILVLQNG